jgi:hypothetical protein
MNAFVLKMKRPEGKAAGPIQHTFSANILNAL